MSLRNLFFLAPLVAATGPPVRQWSDGQPYWSEAPAASASVASEAYPSHVAGSAYAGASRPALHSGPRASETYHGGAAGAAATCSPAAQSINTTWWQGWGGNVWNNHWASNDSEIDVSNANKLTQHCMLTYKGGVSATPTVEGDIIYYPAWNGMVYALNYKTCEQVWETNVLQIAENFHPQDANQKKIIHQASRTSAILEGDVVFFGTQPWALALALNKHTGQLLDKLQLNPHPYAILTLSPTAYNGSQFWGTSSMEETTARKLPNYKCCSFAGNMVSTSFDHSTNKFSVNWNVSSLPLDNIGPDGWAGGAVWGSQPSIDVGRNQVFYGTGNVYRLPKIFEACLNATENLTVYTEGLTTSSPCLGRGVYQQSVLAIDIASGYVNWANQITPLDAWTGACGYGGSIQAPNEGQLPGNENCPYKPGPDSDFGMAPTYVPGSEHTPYGKDMLVIGQKSGNIYGLDAQAGRIFWVNKVAPGGNLGGVAFGIAVDDTQAYFVGINSDLKRYELTDGEVTYASSYGAVNITNGGITWMTSAPSMNFAYMVPSVVNGVALLGYTQNGTDGYDKSNGAMTPVDAKTGKVLHHYHLDAPYHGGIAVQGKWVMTGAGYHSYKGNGSIYVFEAN